MSSQAASPALPSKPKRRRTRLAAIVVAVVAVLAVAIGVGVAVNSPSGSADAATRTVSIGVSDKAQPHWATFVALAKKRLNVNVTLVNFSDYSQPNPALSQKQTDLNEFQHIQFLANYDVTNNDTLVPIASTAIYPLPLYSLKYHSAAGIPNGAQIAIPNDAVNEARGLLVLQSAKLLKLKNGGTAFSTTADIISGRVQVTALDASQTAAALKAGSVAAAIVNKNYAIDAGLTTSEVIAHDDPSSDSALPYLNVFAARNADADSTLYRQLADLYQDPAVKRQVETENGGTAVFKQLSAAALQRELAIVEQDERAAK